MAFQRIRIKNTNVAGKVPGADKLDTAELCINLKDQKLFSKDADGNVFEVGGGVESGANPPDTGNEIGDLFWDGTFLLVWNGSDWVVVGESNLGYTADPAKGTVTNTNGDDVDLPLADDTNADDAANQQILADLEAQYEQAKSEATAIQSRLDGLKEAADQIAEGIPGNVLDRLNRAKEAVAEEQAAADTPPTSEQQAEIDELQSWADDLQSQVDSFKRKIQQAEIQNGETVDSLTADLEAANQQAIEAKEELEAFKESLQTPAEEQQ